MKYTIELDPRELKSLCTACLHLKLDFQREARDPVTSEERREICKKSAEAWDRLRVNLHEQRDAQAAADILGEAVKLDHRVSIYVPGTVDTDKAADNRQQVERVSAEFSRMFGGATATTATGFWMSESAGLVAETTTIVYAACTAEQLNEHLAAVVELAQQIKKDMRQEAVSLSVDSALYII